MTSAPIILWLRQDLRLRDNPALTAISPSPVIPLYIHDPDAEGEWNLAPPQQWWLSKSLGRLSQDYRKHRVQLIYRKGKTVEILRQIMKETGASQIVWNRCYEPNWIATAKEVKAAFPSQSFKGNLLVEPWELLKPYKVYTPFYKACLKTLTIPSPLPTPRIIPCSTLLSSDPISSPPFQTDWTPGEEGAWERLKTWSPTYYTQERDIPGISGTSRLSPHLHFGEITPRQIVHYLNLPPTDKYVSELFWREFSTHLLYHFSHIPTQPFDPRYNHFQWENNLKHLTHWQEGTTGIPIIDAGMRELKETGWMHNRVRMIVASFLTKNLNIPWQQGARWFWDHLIDADLANNSASWQWVAGCGADAAPFFRIFNPILQGEKFDPDGTYVKTWLPNLPDKKFHTPWEVSDTFSQPIVDLKTTRAEALARFEKIKG